MTDTIAIKQRFRSSIKRGTGETHLIMQSNPSINFSAEIIKASLTHYAFDPQSEGSRALYLSELIAMSKQSDKIRAAILEGLANEREDLNVLHQLFELAAGFAKQGDKNARKAIYNRFHKKTIRGGASCGYESIIELDGFDGLVFMATTIGKAIEKHPDYSYESFIIDHCQDEYPEINVYRDLKKAGEENRFIEIYLNNITQTEKAQDLWSQKHPRPVVNYDTVTARINSKAISPLFRAKELPETDLKKLADDFLKETDRLKLEKYLRVFDKLKYPYDYKPILELAKSKYKKSDRLIEFASGALKYFTGADIRKFAIETLKHTKRPADYLDLLVSNFKPEDSKLLTAIAKNCKNELEIHAIVWSYVKIYKDNKTKTCKEPLEVIYAKMNCGMHRQAIVQILKENNVLSKQIKKEIRYDSDSGVRKLA
jgi:hypothetical protein